MFYTLVAERLGLSVSDLRAWDLLVGLGPLSARQVADLTGLTPGAVTGLIDRLERAGAVKRATDPRDRRKVIVTVLSELRTGHASAYFESFQAALGRLYKRYSDEEIRSIHRYSIEIADLLQAEALRLRKSNPAKLKRSSVEKAATTAGAYHDKGTRAAQDTRFARISQEYWIGSCHSACEISPMSASGPNPDPSLEFVMSASARYRR